MSVSIKRTDAGVRCWSIKDTIRPWAGLVKVTFPCTLAYSLICKYMQWYPNFGSPKRRSESSGLCAVIAENNKYMSLFTLSRVFICVIYLFIFCRDCLIYFILQSTLQQCSEKCFKNKVILNLIVINATYAKHHPGMKGKNNLEHLLLHPKISDCHFPFALHKPAQTT